nr:MAG TPA: Thioredoxin domain [Microviridae sp.]
MLLDYELYSYAFSCPFCSRNRRQVIDNRK